MQQKVPRYSWYVLLLLVCVYSVNWMDRYVLVILLEPLKRDLGLSDTSLGLLSGLAFAIVYSFAGIPIARFADTHSRRGVLLAGLTVWSAMTMLCAGARGFVSLGLARLGVAVGEASCSPTAHSLISDYFPRTRRATAFAIYGLGIPIGMALGLMFGGWANEAYGWRMAFVIVGAPGIALAILMWLTVREPQRGGIDATPAETAHLSLPDVIHVLKTRRSFLAFAVGLGLYSFATNSFDTWSPAYLMRVHGMGSGEVGAMLGSMQAVAGISGTLASGLLADHLGARDVRWYLWVTVGAALIMVPSMLVFLHGPPELLHVSYFVTAFCEASYVAPMVAMTQRLMPVRMRALSSALLFLILNLIGPGAGPSFVGIVNDVLASTYGNVALRYSLSIALGGALAGVALTLIAARRLPRDLQEPSPASAPAPHAG